MLLSTRFVAAFRHSALFIGIARSTRVSGFDDAFQSLKNFSLHRVLARELFSDCIADERSVENCQRQNKQKSQFFAKTKIETHAHVAVPLDAAPSVPTRTGDEQSSKFELSKSSTNFEGGATVGHSREEREREREQYSLIETLYV